MQEEEIRRKEYDERYISTIDQNQKELETYSVEISRPGIEMRSTRNRYRFSTDK